jgi:hypothetical protein
MTSITVDEQTAKKIPAIVSSFVHSNKCEGSLAPTGQERASLDTSNGPEQSRQKDEDEVRDG